MGGLRGPLLSTLSRRGAYRQHRKGWYVDNSLGTNGNGQSWATAWNSIANIVWASIGAGDFLYISGGSSSQTYNEILTVGASGTTGRPITITAGIDPGHNGIVILDGSTTTTINSSSSIIDTNSQTNITIQQLTVQNTLENCVHVQGTTSGTVVVQNLIIHTGTGIVSLTTNAATSSGATLHFASVPATLNSSSVTLVDASRSGVIPTGSPPGVSPTTVSSRTSTTIVMSASVTGGGVLSGDTIHFGSNARGIRIENNSGGTVIVQNCTVDDSQTIAQTDSVFTFNNSGTVIVQGCTLTVNNMDSSGHSDCIQSFEDTAITFRSNTLKHPNGGENNHGFLVSDINSGGTVYFYDNVIIMGNTPGNVAGSPEVAVFREYLTSGKTGVAKVWNNTIYGGLAGYETFETAGSIPAGDEFKNNIIYTLPISVAPYNLINGNLTTPANTNNNVVFAQSGNLRISNLGGASVGASLSTTSKSSGLVYFEVQIGMILNSGNTNVGIGNASATLTSFVGASGNNSIGWEANNGSIYLNGGHSNPNTVVAAAGDVVAFAFDFTHSKFWVKDLTSGGGWNNDVIGNQNPATNTGGYSMTGLNAGPYFIMVSAGNSAGEYVVLNAGGSTFVGSVPSGFSAWGSTTTFDNTKIGAATSLSSPIASVAGSYKTFGGWQGLGYDANSLNADPLFNNAGSGDFTIQTGSPAKNAGVTIATVVQDKAGYTRPQGTSYAIGAYEFPI